ncbi:uncharacterized protein METZ01_LOCUS252755 [marine metagenome]|uniref:Uncharacterized protein n=1 Tax=marine metagenome TaxID=408172 RepID=A0A382IMJ2_9ZZZZ
MEQDKSIKTIKEDILDDRPDRYSTASPFSPQKYLNDVTRLKQIGHVSSDKQKTSPLSAGARGLGRVHDFAFKKPNQMMKANNNWRQNTLEDIKVILTKIDTIIKQ